MQRVPLCEKGISTGVPSVSQSTPCPPTVPTVLASPTPSALPVALHRVLQCPQWIPVSLLLPHDMPHPSTPSAPQ